MPDPDPIKVYDARWEVDEFDDHAVRRLFEATFAYGRELKVDTVTFCRDARLGAAHVLDLAVEEAICQGFHVFVCTDPVSTPLSYFTTLYVSRHHPATMGLTITASHNPGQYVGVKFTVPIVQAIGLDCGPAGGLTRIREIYHSNERYPAHHGGSLEIVNLTREYIAFSTQQARIRPGQFHGMSVVLDSFHGSAGPEILTALQRAGVHVEPLHLIPDGRFPAGLPNPTSHHKMDAAIALTHARSCTIAIGVDGDGDRLVFGDRRGVLSAGFAAVPILQATGMDGAQAEVPAVLYDPKVNPLALAEWDKLRVRPVLFRNGHSQIKDYMRRIDAIAAAEESGHYYHRVHFDNLTVTCENTVLTILLFLGAIQRHPDLLDGLRSLQSQVHTTGEFNYQFADDRARDQAMAAMIRQLSEEGADTISSTPEGIDLQGTVVSRGVAIRDTGVSLESDWYSGYLRIATNEKSVVRSYFSAGTLDQMKRVEAQAHHLYADTFGGTLID